MKIPHIIFILLFSGGMLWAQEKRFAAIPPDNVIRYYLTEAHENATLYSGKTETPYDKRFENHPYFETNVFSSGTLCYNRIIYRDVLMRFDLYRNELSVIVPNRSYPVVLNNEKFEYAVLSGSTIIPVGGGKNAKWKFCVLLHNGTYPVTRQYNMKILEETSMDRKIISSFRIQQQYSIYINGVPYSVRSKNAVLKLFPDRRKELNVFAKQNKLNFKYQTEQSIVALVEQYEAMIND